MIVIHYSKLKILFLNMTNYNKKLLQIEKVRWCYSKSEFALGSIFQLIIFIKKFITAVISVYHWINRGF